MIPHTRTVNQQLATPRFNNPKDLVSWMGAIQAQEYSMVKWAIGLRLQQGTLKQVEEAINKGEIIRTHVMRPTWHFVPAEDLKWMLQLSAKRNSSAYESYSRQLGITTDLNHTYRQQIEKMLLNHNYLGAQEIKTELQKQNDSLTISHVNLILGGMENEGIVCSGADKNKKPTYALLEERIPVSNNLSKEEGLAVLAKRYFQSHSPATLEDFVWWSGLNITDARQAINSIKEQLIQETVGEVPFYIFDTYHTPEMTKNSFHFLPSYDEYLISYKSRTPVLAKEHYPKAFNTFGIFYPVILYKGQIIGNWKKISTKTRTKIETSFFKTSAKHQKLITIAEKRFTDFLNG